MDSLDDDFQEPTAPHSALVVKPPVRRQERQLPARSVAVQAPPRSLDVEDYLLSSILLDGPEIIARCLRSGISRRSFSTEQNAVIFDRLLDLARRQVPIDVGTLAEDLRSFKLLDAVGGYAYLVQISSALPTTAQAGFYIEKVREASGRRSVLQIVTWAGEKAKDGAELEEISAGLSDLQKQLAALGLGDPSVETRPMSSYGYPEGDDANILIGQDDYLGRGGGMLLVSHAGAGKSSLIYGMMMTYALGWLWNGIRCNGALKTLCVQSEDSDRYIGKIRASFAHRHKLTQEQVDQIDRNCVIARVKGKSGEEFFVELQKLIDRHKPDIVILNPIYLYVEGDIAKSEFAQPFLVRLDAINAAEKFGYIIVHHTGKPAQRNQKGERPDVDDWETVYLGFGSSYLANWPRCSALLEPVAKSPGRFVLKLGKAGANAGIVREVEQGAGKRLEPVTRLHLRHSTERMKVGANYRPVICWELDEEGAAEAAASKETPKARAPSTGNYTLSDLLRFIPKGEENKIGTSHMERLAITNAGIPKRIFHILLKQLEGEGRVRRDPKTFSIWAA